MKHHSGSIEVVCGSMFSGKTEELIRLLRRAVIAGQKVQVFKPIIDERFGLEKVTSHSGANFDAVPIQSSAQILEKLDKDTTVVGLDETQFFDPGYCEGCPKPGKSGETSDHCRPGYGFPGRTLWLNASFNGHCRECSQTACYLYDMR